MYKKILATVGVLGLLAAAACGGTPKTDTLAYTITGAGDSPTGHDTFLATTPETVHEGDTIQVTFNNTDDMPHSYTIPDLGVNFTVQPGTHTFSFTANKTGSFRWFCAIPCDTDNNGWAMGQMGYMAGTLTVV